MHTLVTFEGNSAISKLYDRPVSLTVAESEKMIFQTSDEEICTQQPIGQ